MFIGNLFGQQVDTRTHLPSDWFVDPVTKIGLEIELEEFPSPEGLENDIYWKLDHDDSLRGKYKTELVLKEPLNGYDLEMSIRALESMVSSSEHRPVQSSRTSTHVHMDATNLTVEQLRDWLLLYIVMERPLFQYCGPVRERSVFCVPLYRAEYALNTMRYLDTTRLEKGDGTFMNQYNAYANSDMRYGAVNFNSLQKWGSLEFRQSKALWTHAPLREWLNILMCIRQYAVSGKVDLDKLYDLVYSEDPTSLLEEVFGDYAKLLYYKGIDKDLIKGIRLAKQYSRPNSQLTPVYWDVLSLTQRYGVETDGYAKFKEKCEAKKPKKEKSPSLHTWSEQNSHISLGLPPITLTTTQKAELIQLMTFEQYKVYLKEMEIVKLTPEIFTEGEIAEMEVAAFYAALGDKFLDYIGFDSVKVKTTATQKAKKKSPVKKKKVAPKPSEGSELSEMEKKWFEFSAGGIPQASIPKGVITTDDEGTPVVDIEIDMTEEQSEEYDEEDPLF